MKLTSEQMKHLSSAQWLFSDTRATGKTTLILYVLLLKAIEFPKMEIAIVDHIPFQFPYWERILRPLLFSMIKDPEFSEYNFVINNSRASIKMIGLRDDPHPMPPLQK